ncbi:MAG: DUF1501 domain-containing protein [Bryobacterales bacterium]|nr:DUF1501 domain-containing protein [Bryobacterales bacterium]MDE0295183.1 DUF1501 domain-containing protein [Bryobacterales bacterium]
MKRPVLTAKPSRRELLYHSGMGLGTIALSAMLQKDRAQAGVLAPKRAHHDATAKNCIFLLMEGGPSHIDTFDPKPKLVDLHMTEFVKERNKFEASMNTGKRYFVRSPFDFRRAGRMGIEINAKLAHFADCVDDVCFYRGLQATSVNHPTALYHLNTGNRFGGDPAIGAWVTYGLGTENQNLPGFVVLPDLAFPQGGAGNWSNGFLPAHYQGTPLRSQGAPVLDIRPPEYVTEHQQRKTLDFIGRLNRSHSQRHPHHDELASRIESYELAFRMQAEMPEAINIDLEPKATRELYGVGSDNSEVDSVGRRCLLARRLVERGVRFVQVIVSGWDSHDYIEKAHGKRLDSIDRPIAGLLKDLKRSGLLEETLVVWAGEFGRTPDNGLRGGQAVWGRDHNAPAMAFWIAGGGAPRGKIVGATDETGRNAVETVHPIQNMHVTLLHLLGLDDTRLTYFAQGREKQLSQTGGELIKELIA